MSGMRETRLLTEEGRIAPCIRCDHASCYQCTINWDRAEYVKGLLRPGQWWPICAVHSMARMIYHACDGHGEGDGSVYRTKAYLVCDLFPGARGSSFAGEKHRTAIGLARDSGNLDKVIIVFLLPGHYVVLLFEINMKQVRLVNGLAGEEFSEASSSAASEYAREWFTSCAAEFGGGADVYSWVQEPYLIQDDSVNCGPIAVLAVHYELTGVPMIGEEKGSVFPRSLREAVVNKHVEMFKELYNDRRLVCRISNEITSAEVPWDYVVPDEAYKLPLPAATSFGDDAARHASELRPLVEGGQGRDGESSPSSDVATTANLSDSYPPSAVAAETPERSKVLMLKVTPEVQAGPLLGSHGGVSGDPKGTSAVEVGATGTVKIPPSQGRDREPALAVDNAASPAPNSSLRDRIREARNSHGTGSSAEGNGNDSVVSTGAATVLRVEPAENDRRLNEAFAAVCTSLTKRKIASVVLRDIFKLVCAVAKEKDEFSYLCSVATLNDVPNTGADVVLDTPARVSIQTPDVRKAIKAAAENWHRQKFEDAKKWEATAFGESVYQEFNVGRKFLAIAKDDAARLPPCADVPLTHPEHWFWKSIDSRICENATMWRMKKYNQHWHQLNKSGSVPGGLVEAKRLAELCKQHSDRPAGAAASGSGAQGTKTATPRRRLLEDLENEVPGLPNKRPRTRSQMEPVAVDGNGSESGGSNEREGDRAASRISSPSRSSTCGADRPFSDPVAGASGEEDVYKKLRDLLHDVGAKQTFERLLKCSEPKELRLTVVETRRLYILLQSVLTDPSESDELGE